METGSSAHQVLTDHRSRIHPIVLYYPTFTSIPCTQEAVYRVNLQIHMSFRSGRNPEHRRKPMWSFEDHAMAQKVKRSCYQTVTVHDLFTCWDTSGFYMIITVYAS